MFGLDGVFGPTSQLEHSPMNTTLVQNSLVVEIEKQILTHCKIRSRLFILN